MTRSGWREVSPGGWKIQRKETGTERLRDLRPKEIQAVMLAVSRLGIEGGQVRRELVQKWTALRSQGLRQGATK